MDNSDPVLAEHKALIDSLKPLTKQDDFATVFLQQTEQLSRPQRFLIKMELTRLSTPCTRQIDLRGHVDGICREYTHSGITHFMDNTAINLFEQGLKTYGLYTTGVYEQVLNAENNYRVMHKAEQQQRLQNAQSNNVENTTEVNNPFLVKPVYFGDRGARKEERMNYAMPVELDLSVDNRLSAITTDLSVNGVRLKILKPVELELNQTFYLKLVGLEQEFALGLKDKIEYKITQIEDKADYIYVNCERLNPDNSTQGFDRFLNNFINGNKRRYKLNVDNTITGIITKGYEQYYLPRITSLPVFIEADNDGELYGKFCLVTDNNMDIAKQWYDENNHNCLNQLLTSKRLKLLLSQSGQIKETVIYAFTHVYKGKIHFYSATADELTNSGLAELFLGFASRKNNWMVYKLQLTDINPQLAELTDTLPQEQHSHIHSFSPKITKLIENFKYIAYLTELNDENSRAIYQQNSFELTEVNQLNQFKHDKTLTVKNIHEVAIRYINLRKESRFSYKTQVEITHVKEKIQGVTRNFSTQGLQIELAESSKLNLPKGAQIQLDFPELQKSFYQLKNLAYEVVALNDSKTLLSLKINKEAHKRHKAQQFFKTLIKQNQQTLALDEQANIIPQLAEVLRNISIQKIVNMAYFIHKDGLKHQLKAVGFSQLNNPLVKLFSDNNQTQQLNLQALLQHNQFNSVMIDMLRRLQRDDTPKYQDLMIRVQTYEQDINKRFITRTYQSFNTDDDRYNFIKRSCQNGTLFFAVRIFLSRTGRPDMDFIANELLYVSQYAIHKAKGLEDELWSVEGVGDLIDISEELMLRFNLPNDKIKQQLELKQAYSS
ncbi:PilZ domain-containing protein [Catenovulum sp. 2E275]|uniref:PilZ domain-containing protein n=1 Tax=Catenovulum sp. 2E275 TaxID=2980497 RepID=UPI0021D02B43|nr:PilZ domain-containing protein [Catenovulum sp. 2E275]MCU4676489.1 PilZ domain-containing protein [Catenovulum sp. 2E275]